MNNLENVFPLNLESSIHDEYKENLVPGNSWA